MEKRLFSPAFGQFLERLCSGENTPEAAPLAVGAVSSELNLGRMEIILHQPPSIYTPQGEELNMLLYQDPAGYEPKEDFVFEHHSGEGGTAIIKAWTVQGAGTFAPEQREVLTAVCRLMILHGGRYRLIGKVKQNAFINYQTGLPNSGGYVQRIGQKIAQGKIGHFDAIYLNLQNFGLISQRFGGEETDNVIRRYAGVLLKLMEEGEVLSHFGGDNFTALVYKSHTTQLLKQLRRIETFAQQQGERIPLSIYSTVGVFPLKEGMSPNDVISGSATALSFARSRKLSVMMMTPEVYERVNRTKLMVHDFRTALEKHQVEAYYQPKVDVRSGRIIGAEALARWTRDDEVISSSEFVPLLESSGNCLALDMFMLKSVCADIRAWLDEGRDSVPVSVNFSRKDFSGTGADPVGIARMICRTIEEANVPTSMITVEVTETTDAVEQEHLRLFLQELRDGGIATSIDDFGTGYSSLSMLRDFPINEIKIDRSFINHENLGSHDEIILRSIIDMAQKLGLHIITEGVENIIQVQFLKRLGCHHVQGFLYDKALPKCEWEARLKEDPYVSI